MEKAFRRDYGSLDQIFAFINEALASEEANETVVFSINLATEELFTNMVKYNAGSGGQIKIRIRISDGALVVRLIDDDVDPFDPNAADMASVDDAVEDRRIGGLGLRLVRSVVDRISYEYKDRRMTVELVKQLEQ
jgi:anti-sigma regulatory factor (Ser/Thr protein kinase)